MQEPNCQSLRNMSSKLDSDDDLIILSIYFDRVNGGTSVTMKENVMMGEASTASNG